MLSTRSALCMSRRKRILPEITEREFSVLPATRNTEYLNIEFPLIKL